MVSRKAEGSAAADLSKAAALWLTRDTILVSPSLIPFGTDADELEWLLQWSEGGGIDPDASEPLPWGSAWLVAEGWPSPELLARAPHVAGHRVLRLDAETVAAAPEILKGQIVVAGHAASGRLVGATGVQIAGVLDDLYADAANATLGVSWDAGRPTLRVWAPTARQVELLLWTHGDGHGEPDLARPMEPASDGTWALTGEPGWRHGRYRYRITVYVAAFGREVVNVVSDPYSLALTINSTHSLVIDLDDPALVPDVFRDAPQPTLATPVDQCIYELHVRDFSIHDKTVPLPVRGTYLAFAEDSAGTRHLRGLAAAGLNTVQLLPVFDNASVEEHHSFRAAPEKASLMALPPDSPEQQRRVRESRNRDGFNWGYDPFHYFAPEGSYATMAAADTAVRITEFRTMIGSLHAMGLRVVTDQVFNHTATSGQNSKSVLDRVVPGYYHRLSLEGEVETSTCCANIATENLMAQKLMVDACVVWAKHHRVDGFRFDLMGHSSKANLLAVRAALDALTVERDGVDGRAVTMYGEGWNFGEVAWDARFVQARQGNLGGTHIATFNDRLRDAVRGGGPFDEDPRGQGLGTGLFTDDNGSPVNGDPGAQERRLFSQTDLAQIGLAGGLRRFAFASAGSGTLLRGDGFEYSMGSAGYCDAPDEAINYVDAHDNETLFDVLALKLPVGTPMADRVRMNTVCLAFATLSQSPVLWHAGSDFLRTKNLDRNSYSSGDWFNYLDFSLTHNGFGAGLPPEQDNGHVWSYLRPLLANPDLRPESSDIRAAHAQALDLLRLRASSRLFRLGSAEAIIEKVSFPVSGSWVQRPGVIAMLLDDRRGVPVDPLFAELLVVFNTTPHEAHQALPGVSGQGWVLHPVHEAGFDEIVRRTHWSGDGVTIPGRTVAVLVRPRD